MGETAVTTVEVSRDDRFTRSVIGKAPGPSRFIVVDNSISGTLFEGCVNRDIQAHIWPLSLQSLFPAQDQRYKFIYTETDSDLVAPSTRDFTNPGSLWEPYVLQRLNEMAAMTTEYRPADEILNRAWNTAHRYFSSSTPTPSIVLGDEGSVLFVWHKSGWDVELEIGNKSSYVGILRRENKQTLFGPLDEMHGDLLEVLKNMSDAI